MGSSLISGGDAVEREVNGNLLMVMGFGKKQQIYKCQMQRVIDIIKDVPGHNDPDK